MSTPERGERDEELLRRYRQASDAQPAAPSPSVRAAILAEARKAAAEYAEAPDVAGVVARGVSSARVAEPAIALRTESPRRARAGWKYALLGTASAAVLAGILVLPRFLQHPPQVARVTSDAPVAADETARVREATAPPPAAAPEQAASPQAARQQAAPQPAAPVPAATNSAEPLAKSEAARGPALARADTAHDAAIESEATTGLADKQADAELREAPAMASAPAVAPAGASAPPAAFAAKRRIAASSPLIEAVAAADLPRLRQLIAEGTPLEAADAQGRTPLMLATVLGREEAVKALLAGGANPNAADAAGRTPLQAAMAANRESIAVLLRAAGAR
jgi:hypothetical protein